MFYSTQVNIGTNSASLLGLIQIVFGLFYAVFLIVQLTRISHRISSLTITLYIIQLVIVPIFLLLSGIILIFQGWRLDPILQFQQLMLSALIFFLSLNNILVQHGANK